MPDNKATISARENFLRAIEFRYPQWIPHTISLEPAVWFRYGPELEALVLRHPRIFPDYRPGSYPRAPTDPFYEVYEHRVDDWGCVWRNTQPGILGQVIGHPLADWSALDKLRPPDPREQYDWRAIREGLARAKEHGHIAHGYISVTQGGFFDRLQFLRGMQNLLIDFATDPPELSRLIEMVLEYNLEHVRLWLEAGVEHMNFHGDIGSQSGLMFSPATFRKYLKPAYSELFWMCRRAGVHVTYSSDGYMLSLVDDLIECGVSVHDPEVRTNTAEGIARAYNGRLCTNVQLDALMFSTCTPEDIRQQVAEVVRIVGKPEGGLMLYAYVGSDVPLENIEALCTSYEEFCWQE